MTGNVYAILGGRGGVGATTTALALGASLAETAHRVAVIDADFEGEGVGAALDLGDPDRTLGDVLRGDADLDDALVEAAHGLQVLPSGDAAPAPTDVRSHALVRAADRVRERFDFVLLDLGATAGTPAALALERADGAILAATPTSDAIAAVADAATVARFHGADVLGTAFTKIPEGTEIDHEAAAEALETDVIAMVPEDDAVAESAAAGASLLRHDPDSPAAMVYWELAGRLADGDLAGEPVVREGPTAESDEQESPASDSQASEQRRSGANDAAPRGPAGADAASSDDAASRERDEADPARADDAEPVAPPAPDAATEQDSVSASAREDAADRSTSERGSAALDDGSETATGSGSDDGGDDPSRNEFSWNEDPIEDDETTGDDGSPLDDEPALGEDRDDAETGADDETDPEPAAESEADEKADVSDEDDIDAAFKATMDKVREQNGDANDDDDDEDGDEESGGMFGIGG